MKYRILLCLLATYVAALRASAQLLLTFEGLKDLESIQSFYNGGTGSLGSTGPNYGIVFNGGLTLIDTDAGGGGNFGLEPSSDTAAFPDATMNVLAGFDTTFSMFYSTVDGPGTVTVWSGLDGTGSALATFNLEALGVGPGDPTGAYSNWKQISASLAETAYSVTFSGVFFFDNVALGPVTEISPVPEPSTYGLFGTFALIGFVALRRFRGSSHSTDSGAKQSAA